MLYITFIITFLFWGVVIILDTKSHPNEWYLFFIPMITMFILEWIISLVSQSISLIFCIIVHFGMVLLGIKSAYGYYKEKKSQDTKNR